MDIAFFLGILIIVGVTGSLGFYSIRLYHERRVTELRIEEHASQAKFMIMEKALEQKMLPPSSFYN